MMRRFLARVDAIQLQVAARHPLADLLLSTMRTYGEGVKILFRESLIEFRRKRTDPLSYRAAVFSRSVRSDLKTGIPCAVFFGLPFVGNLLPVMAYFFPLILPDAWKSRRVRTEEMIAFQNRKLRYEYCGSQVSSNVDYLRATGFRRVWVPRTLQQRLAHRYRKQVDKENQLLRGENLHDLTIREIQEALYFRGEPCVPYGLSADHYPYYSPFNGRHDPIGNPSKGTVVVGLLLSFSLLTLAIPEQLVKSLASSLS